MCLCCDSGSSTRSGFQAYRLWPTSDPVIPPREVPAGQNSADSASQAICGCGHVFLFICLFLISNPCRPIVL